MSTSRTPDGGLRPVPQRSKLMRFWGINLPALKDYAPARKTVGIMALVLSPVGLYFYDRSVAAKTLEEYKERVKHLADVQLDQEHDELEFPRKIWIMSTRVPDDTEDDRGSRWFKTYIKPVLYAAGYDYSFLNGTAPGALGRRIRDRIRLDRIGSSTPQPQVSPGEAGYLETLDKRRHAKGMGLTVLVGRNTFKEYFWGLKQGWLVNFDAIREERGDDAKLNELKEQLDMDGAFEEETRPVSLLSAQEDGEDGDAPIRSAVDPRAALTVPRMSYPPQSSMNYYSSSSSSSSSSPQQPEETRSLIIPAASEIPVQPPILVLPFDHPLGYLRYWPLKMVKYLFLERYRVKEGCETALSIIQAIHPSSPHSYSSFSGLDESLTGLRHIKSPKVPSNANLDERELEVKLEDILSEDQKKLQEPWRGSTLPETGSPDLDFDASAEYHYRKTFTDTPVNNASARRLFYKELPEKLKVARELARRDRLPTKDEQKYPPPTEDDLKQERLNKEKKWRNDYYGWLMTRVGGKITWDSRFESLRVLDLQSAKQAREKQGFVGDVKKEQSEFA